MAFVATLIKMTIKNIVKTITMLFGFKSISVYSQNLPGKNSSIKTTRLRNWLLHLNTLQYLQLCVLTAPASFLGHVSSTTRDWHFHSSFHVNKDNDQSYCCICWTYFQVFPVATHFKSGLGFNILNHGNVSI